MLVLGYCKLTSKKAFLWRRFSVCVIIRRKRLRDRMVLVAHVLRIYGSTSRFLISWHLLVFLKRCLYLIWNLLMSLIIHCCIRYNMLMVLIIYIGMCHLIIDIRLMSERLFTRQMLSKVWILPTVSSTVREAYFQVIQRSWKPCIWQLSKPLKNGLWAFRTGDRSTANSALCMRDDSRNNRIYMHDEKDVLDVCSWHARNHVVYIARAGSSNLALPAQSLS